jgi:heat shock protein HslJ/uncharacterized lipoprotein NlpE involved in copper resistance
MEVDRSRCLGRLAGAAAVLLAAASAQEFRLGELTTYMGTLPCPDCLGVRQVVTLRPDGFFYRERSFLKTQSSGQRVMDIGHWTAAGERLILHSSLGDSQNFAILAQGALQLLDEAGQAARAPAQAPGGSKPDDRLSPEPQAYVPQGTYRLRGIYTQTRGRGRFQPCGGTLTLGVETTGRPKLLERLAQATAGGKAALLTASGTLEGAAGGGAGKEVLRIANVVAAEPGGSCGAGPASAIPRPGAEEEARVNRPRVIVVKMPAGMAVNRAGGNALNMPAGMAPGGASGEQKSQNESSAPLLDTMWMLTELANDPVPGGTGQREASLRMQSEGHASGWTGCNRFSGSYTLEGRLLHFGPLALTRMACPDGGGVEAQYMRALEATRQYQIHGNTLDLLDAGGRNAARFKAALGR